MITDTIHENRQTAKDELAREVDLRACEGALLAALTLAQRARLGDAVVAQIGALHAVVGSLRREIEGAAE